MLIDFGEKGREREGNIDRLPLRTCSEQESNPKPFGVWDLLQPLSDTGQDSVFSLGYIC